VNRARAALIITHNRPRLLADCIRAIRPQVDDVLVLDNASDPRAHVPPEVWLEYIPDQPPNLARFWNHGFDFFDKVYSGKPYDLAVLCDDAIVPDGWFNAVVTGLRDTNAAIGCSNPWGMEHPPMVKTSPDSNIMGRMIGWAFVIDATRGLRADESMQFWWFDTDLDFRARAAGGFVMVGGFPVPNMEPGHYTNARPELGAQTAIDRETFRVKYNGWLPW
jgi:glycosyltransferase involved in cell wall biosynthesis